MTRMTWLIIAAAVGAGLVLVVLLGGRLRALLQLYRFGRAVVASDPEVSFHLTRYGLIEPWLMLVWSVPAKQQTSLSFIPSLLSANCFWSCWSLVELCSDIDRLRIYPPEWHFRGSDDVRLSLDVARAGGPRPDLEAYCSAEDDPARIADLLGHPAMKQALEQFPPAVKLEIWSPGGGVQTQIRMYDGSFPPSHDRLAVWRGALDLLGDALEQALQSRPYR
jgi:hypothetical protein